MSALDSIIKWAEEDLIDWQSDAVRRLLLQEQLDTGDEEEILRTLKERHGIMDPKNPAPKPRPLKMGDASGAPHTTAKITLKALKDVNNVNAIPNGSGLPFAHKGMTVIYGENGSGKSGYARVLKKACNARDRKERILPNVYKKKTPSPAQACIKYSVNDGPDTEIVWKDGDKAEPSVLSSVCVFDSKCARVIVDENNETTYLPYGANVFEEMVSLYKHLREMLEAERPKPTKLEYADIPQSTGSGKFISDLTQDTRDDVINQATTWKEDDEAKLAKLQVYIKRVEIDAPDKQTQRLRNLKRRIITLSESIQRIHTALSEDNAGMIRQGILNLIAAEEALSVASKESLSAEPLPGAGEKAWQKLYNAAKEYSIQAAYPGREFPVTEEGSLCVLCMQPLGLDARARMLRFKEFMQKATKKDVDSAVTNLQNLMKDIENLRFPPLDSFKDITDEFREEHEELVTNVEEYFPAMEARTKEIVQAVKDKNAVAEFKMLPPRPDQGLMNIGSQLEAEAKEIEKTGMEYEQKKREKVELEAKKLLFSRREQIFEYANQLRLRKKYDLCIAETDFTNVTKKGKKIITGVLTPQLIQALQNELKTLGATHLPLNLKATGTEGETKHKLELKGSHLLPKSNLSDILSEGEHCVVAVAGFLAELKLGNPECPIIFDDPVCSLDHNYRERIAKRLVEEAKKRQVIIFTHDIAFLTELESKAAETGRPVCFTPETVCNISGTVGKCLDGHPWHAMLVKDRIAFLKEELQDFKNLYGSNQPEYNRKAAELYALLRETWEALVEETLLFQTVKRHGNEIQTQRLRSVKVETEDYKTIHFGMSKCSEWMLGHDKSKALSTNRPEPKEIHEEIEKLDRFAREVRKRHEILRKEREKAVEPTTTAMG